MKTVAAREAKNHFGELMDDARIEPVLVERNDRRAAIVLSPKLLDELLAA
jgi:PHD/YefM family antitoxin component YafN of YafNO toxin-antitoxin module